MPMQEVDEIHRIFGTLGTPTDETWQGMSSLPYGNRPFPMWPAKPWSVVRRPLERS